MKTKKLLNEPDFIGGQGPLTKEEEEALRAYFAKKKKLDQVVVGSATRKAA